MLEYRTETAHLKLQFHIRVLRLRQTHLNICEIESLDGSEVSARWVLRYQRNNKTDVFSDLIFRGNGTMISER